MTAKIKNKGWFLPNTMGTLTLDLTIQVFNLSPRLTPADINAFFSYCGTVDNIQILRNTSEDKGSSQSALVTFRQPYSFQTALLLNDAILADQPICVLPARVFPIPIISDEDVTDQTEKKREGHVAEYGIASKGAQVLKKKETKLQEKRRVVAEQTKSGVGAAEEAAGRVYEWLSGMVEKASNFASHLHLGAANTTTGTDNIDNHRYKHKHNPNTRKNK